MYWQPAPDISERIASLLTDLQFAYNPKSIFSFRGYGSSSRATARIWPLPKIWQLALNQSPAYCIEIIAEKFDKLSEEEKQKILIHEILHIPKNFSGALVPHRNQKRRTFRDYHKMVEALYSSLKK